MVPVGRRILNPGSGWPVGTAQAGGPFPRTSERGRARASVHGRADDRVSVGV